MPIESFATVIPVEDMSEAVAFWGGLLGVQPTFVDGDRWAQFDAFGRRLALAGTDRFADQPSLMLKASDIEAVRADLSERGAEVSEVMVGAHERRFTAVTPGGWVVTIYASL